MSDPTTKLLDTIDRFAKAKKEAEAATKELRRTAHEAVQERMRLEKVLKAVKSAPSERVDELIAEAVVPQIKELTRVITDRQRQLEQTTFESHEKQVNMLLYGNVQGRGKSIFDQFREKYADMQIMLDDLKRRIEGN